MAPEVTLSLPYNEQADVFSLGTVIWELLSRKTIGAAVLSGATGDLSRVAELYAHRVARGFRPPLPLSWPEEVRTLVTECWDARPAVRPRAGEVGKRLQALLTKGTFAEFDAVREKEEDEAVWAAMAEAKSAREMGVAAEIAGCLGCCSVM
jgi:serine/threonine protein kinase